MSRRGFPFQTTHALAAAAEIARAQSDGERLKIDERQVARYARLSLIAHNQRDLVLSGSCSSSAHESKAPFRRASRRQSRYRNETRREVLLER